ncbi:sensor histidine kinase [Nonomuraea sp. CA-143628]|uniref:sensor histidine kinase n=1 Tax=Nonomuraea sp. CA-143628 TaxID=3239997 RepID=UPI003D8CC7FF
MSRFAVVALVVIADTVLLWLDGTVGWELAGYAVLTALVMTLGARLPFVAFVVAVPMAVVSGASLVLLACTSYRAGRRMRSRVEEALTIGATVAYVGLLLMIAHRAMMPPEPWLVLARAVVLVVLPVLAGRYLTRQEEYQRRERELVAEQERLRERLRIARDMHDSLGQALSLMSVQAAALEVAALPAHQRQGVRDLARAARAAMDELHMAVGRLRGDDSPGPEGDDSPGLEGIETLVAEFRRAGVAVRLERSGQAAPLGGLGAGHAAYRVVQEGLTNAAKHAPGSPVTVSLDWQPDALLLGVDSPARGTAPTISTGGTGLTGLAERVGSAGGLLRVHDEPHTFRLVAMLPVVLEAVA